MIVFSEYITPRLTYTLNQVLKKQLGIEYSYTNDFEAFCHANTPKINYSNLPTDSGFHIIPEGLLFENNIRKDKPALFINNEVPYIFNQDVSDLNFDIFSAVFWFLSRYEEYQEYTPDTHNRFAATESFAFKNNLLNRPIIDEWIQHFGELLEKKFERFQVKQNKFSALTTIDVDSPWCYRNKGIYRNTAGLFRDVLKGKFNDVIFRIKVLLNILPDPWYNFDWIMQMADKNNTQLMFFIHVGDYGSYDKTVNYKSKAFINFVKTTAGKAEIGLHPSYKAANNKTIFHEELKRLSAITTTNVLKSRQHYLVFSTANYYPQLVDLGITDDYSMGFADKAGFRAGTSNPFYFFDLIKNEETNLLIHPFVVMDRTLNSYESKSVEKSIESVKSLITTIKKVNGTFVSLWHNESLSNRHEWMGWQSFYQHITEYLSNKS